MGPSQKRPPHKVAPHSRGPPLKGASTQRGPHTMTLFLCGRPTRGWTLCRCPPPYFHGRPRLRGLSSRGPRARGPSLKGGPTQGSPYSFGSHSMGPHVDWTKTVLINTVRGAPLEPISSREKMEGPDWSKAFDLCLRICTN
jgi:hypothetical protein